MKAQRKPEPPEPRQTISFGLLIVLLLLAFIAGGVFTYSQRATLDNLFFKARKLPSGPVSEVQLKEAKDAVKAKIVALQSEEEQIQKQYDLEMRVLDNELKKGKSRTDEECQRLIKRTDDLKEVLLEKIGQIETYSEVARELSKLHDVLLTSGLTTTTDPQAKAALDRAAELTGVSFPTPPPRTIVPDHVYGGKNERRNRE